MNQGTKGTTVSTQEKGEIMTNLGVHSYGIGTFKQSSNYSSSSNTAAQNFVKRHGIEYK